MTTRIQTFGGNIGIGTDDPGSFKLNVNGDIKADSLIINGVTNSQVPIGLIQIWYGTVETIPAGWVLCDGTTGITRSDGGGTIDTPDLSTRFVRGVSTTPQVGQSGGANTITLSEASLPPHAHTFTSANSNAPHNHGIVSSNHTHSHIIGSGGGGHGHTMDQQSGPHDHPVANANCSHNHGVQTGDSAPETSHGHAQPANEDAPHTHQYQSGYPSLAGGGPKRVYAIFPSQILATGSSNAPHGHTTNNAQAPHKHNYNAANAPHTHQSGAANVGHPHSVNANSDNHAHTIPDDNAPHGHNMVQNDGTHSHTGTTASTGQENSIAIQNPYYTLTFIMKI